MLRLMLFLAIIIFPQIIAKKSLSEKLKPIITSFLSYEKNVSEHLQELTKSLNQGASTLYHYIGTLIIKEKKKQGWGTKIIDRLSIELQEAFPEMRGFGARNLKTMVKFARLYTNISISETAVSLMPWGHISRLIQMVKSPKIRNFYIKNTILNNWSRSTMIEKIESEFHKQKPLPHTLEERLPPVNERAGEEEPFPVTLTKWLPPLDECDGKHSPEINTKKENI